MCICSGCGKVIENKFLYCPWCGYSRFNKETEESIELKYNQYKMRQQEERIHQLEKMEQELDDLEKELSVLVLSVQMAK